MALTQDAIRKVKGLPEFEEHIAIATNATVYRGSLCSKVIATGRAKAAAPLATERFVGLVTDLRGSNGVGTGVGDASGTEYAVVQYGHQALVTVKTAIRTNAALGRTVFIGDDDSVAGTAIGTATLRRPVGTLVSFEASDKSTGWVELRQPSLDGNIAI